MPARFVNSPSLEGETIRAAGWGGLGHFGRIFIWANGISFMRWAADSTATSPVPPMLAMHRPPVMAASMG